MEQKLQMKIFLLFHLFLSLVGGPHGGRRAHTPPTAQSWKDFRGGFLLLVGGSPRELVRGFGNEGVVLNEGAWHPLSLTGREGCTLQERGSNEGLARRHNHPP